MGPMMGATSTSASYEKSPRSTRMNVSYAFVNEWYSSSCDPNVVIAMAAYRAVTAMKMMQKWNKSLAATVRVFVMTFKRSWNWKVFSRRSNARRYTKHEMSCTTARSTRNTGCECDVTK